METPQATTQTETTSTEVSPKPESVFETKPGETAPEPFDPAKLELPEGFVAEGEGFEQFTNIAKELGLPHAKAQELVGLHAAAVTKAMQGLTDQWQAKQTEWLTELKADKELGGANLEVVKQTVAKVLDNTDLTDPGFREALNFTGAGTNPAIVRSLYRWAKALTEGGSVAGGATQRNAQGQLANQPQSIAQSMYGPSGPHSGGPKI